MKLRSTLTLCAALFIGNAHAETFATASFTAPWVNNQFASSFWMHYQPIATYNGYSSMGEYYLLGEAYPANLNTPQTWSITDGAAFEAIKVGIANGDDRDLWFFGSGNSIAAIPDRCLIGTSQNCWGTTPSSINSTSDAGKHQLTEVRVELGALQIASNGDLFRSGTISFIDSVSPVPEPSTAALLIAGGVVVSATQRRSQKKGNVKLTTV